MEQRLRDEYDQSPIVETIKRLLKQGNGHWKGTVTEVINACNVLLHHEVTETPQQVGVWLNKYDIFFQLDGIDHDVRITNKNRYHSFVVTNVTDDTVVTDVTDVTV